MRKNLRGSMVREDIYKMARALSRDTSPSSKRLVSACSDHTGRPDKSGPMALNQFRLSVPVWSKTL